MSIFVNSKYKMQVIENNYYMIQWLTNYSYLELTATMNLGLITQKKNKISFFQVKSLLQYKRHNNYTEQINTWYNQRINIHI